MMCTLEWNDLKLLLNMPTAVCEKLNYHKLHFDGGFMKVFAGQLNAFENASLFCKVPITLGQKIDKLNIEWNM